MSQFLSVKNRMPFVRRPSSESLMEGGAMAQVPLDPMSSRPASLAASTDGLRPLSLRSLPPINTQDLDPPLRRGWRESARDRSRDAGHWAQDIWQQIAGAPHAVGVGLALGGLTIWCVTLTVYVARSRADINALGSIPFCEDLGLVHKG